MTPPLLHAIHLYPIKSCKGLSVPEAEITPRGLKHDRRWMIVDDQGHFLTQRSLAQLALIDVQLEGDQLLLQVPEQPLVRLPLEPQEGEWQNVLVWEDQVPALQPSSEANQALQAFLGQPCALVFQPESTHRPVDPDYGQPEDLVSFADGFPLLLATEASLEELNRRLEQPVTMQRFRPNLVVANTAPHAEDHWPRLRIGTTAFRSVKPCARCVMTTVDPQAGTRDGKEPLATLATYRKFGGKVMFGQNLIPDLPEAGACLRVGDAVEVF